MGRVLNELVSAFNQSVKLVSFDVAPPRAQRFMSDVTYICGDIRKSIHVERAFKEEFISSSLEGNPYTVLNIAGLLPNCLTTEQELFGINELGTVILLDACKKFGCHNF